MSAANDGGPAFPGFNQRVMFGDVVPLDDAMFRNGMSLRDWFAGQETLAEFDEDGSSANPNMAESLAGWPMPEHGWRCKTSEQWLAMLQWDSDWRARLKFIRADAMLRAREGGGK